MHFMIECDGEDIGEICPIAKNFLLLHTHNIVNRHPNQRKKLAQRVDPMVEMLLNLEKKNKKKVVKHTHTTTRTEKPHTHTTQTTP